MEKLKLKVIMDLSHHALNSRGMPNKWKTGVIVPAFMERVM